MSFEPVESIMTSSDLVVGFGVSMIQLFKMDTKPILNERRMATKGKGHFFRIAFSPAENTGYLA